MSRRTSSAVLAAACLLAAGCAGTNASGSGGTSGPQQNSVGTLRSGVFPAGSRQDVPALAGTTLDGAHLALASLRGRVVVLNFWASWCNPCRAEARNLASVYARTRAAGVAFVGIDIKDDADAARGFVRDHAVPYPNLYDQSGQLLLAFRGRAPQAPPTTLVLDRTGRVAAAFYGQAVTEDELLGPVQAVAAEAA